MSLSALELSSIRTAATAFLPGTAYIVRPTLTSDGQGGYTTAWGTVGTADCRIAPAGDGSERIAASKLAAIGTWVVTLPSGTNVDAKDRLVTDGRTLEVQAVAGTMTWEAHRRVLCTEVS